MTKKNWEIPATIFYRNANNTEDHWFDRPEICISFELDGTKYVMPLGANREILQKMWWVVAGKPKLPSFGEPKAKDIK